MADPEFCGQRKWSYSSVQESIDEAFYSAGIRSNKKTHISCSSSARMADITGVNEDQIRRQGRGNNTTMKDISHQSSKRNDAINGRQLSPDNNDPIQPTAAANAFVQVIMMFRKTFIQDSVLMMELHPCHPIWQHSIFSDSAYLDLLQMEAQEHDPAHTLLQQCVPMHSEFQTQIVL
ncbi:hypothetical protein [Absidia glauca]|uniref:Ndc10 domain-containing protein n=1 Tax=Absidia glauca TaxID=4829 RepID=A0A163K4Q6_ABSGL|nr:hypothetical protein [Absidia glauca]